MVQRKKNYTASGNIAYPNEVPAEKIEEAASEVLDMFGPMPAEVKPAEPEKKSQTRRCRSIHPSMSELRCVLDAGHSDYHCANGQSWVGDTQASPAAVLVSSITDIEYATNPVVDPKVVDDVLVASPPPPPAEPKKSAKTEAKQKADERRIQQVIGWLKSRGELVRFGGYLFWAFVEDAEENANDPHPLVLRVWTEHDLVVWFNSASKHMGRTGCTLGEAIDDTMPESRKTEPVEDKPVEKPNEGTLWTEVKT